MIYEKMLFLAAALHRLLQDDLQGSLADHAAKSCIVCNPDSVNSTSDAENGEDFSPIKSVSFI